jgi:hypothetical protein
MKTPILSTPRLLVSLFVALALLAAWIGLPVAAHVSAQSVDPRIGIGYASEAPQIAYNSGAGWELAWFKWDALQPGGPGDWDTSSVSDEWLGDARASGREVVGVLWSTPAWATTAEPGTGVPRGLYLPVNDPGNLWAGFVRQAVSYYSTRGVNRWVIWDRPDVPSSGPNYAWSGTIEDYYQLVKVAYIVAKEANPAAQIHLGGIVYYDATWFGRFLDVVLADPTAVANNYYFDVATVNVFFVTEWAYTLPGNQYYIMSQRGIEPLKPVWINQTDARPGSDPGFYPEDVRFSSYQRITLDQQASFIIQSFALGFASGAERIAIARLATTATPEDDASAFGLIRANGIYRPAFYAYQVVAQEFAGFVYARRQPDLLADYVRLTFADKVTHVGWSRSAETATLIIPARSAQATLIDQWGNRSVIEPEGGEYRVVLEGALCNDPINGCVIGGPVWLLVEEGLEAPLEETPPEPRFELGGVPPTPNPDMFMTATAQALAPTSTPTKTPAPPTETPTPSALPTEAVAAPPAEATGTLAVAEAGATSEAPPAEVEETPPTPEPTPVVSDIQPPPRGFSAVLPFLLVGLGTLVIGGGIGYFLNTWFLARRRGASAEWTSPTGEEQPGEHEDDLP